MLIVSSFPSSSGAEMTDIPDDIMSAAARVIDDCETCDTEGSAMLIARAILAERQACERIARDEAMKMHRVGSELMNMREYQSNLIAGLIAARSKFSSGSSSLPGSAA